MILGDFGTLLSLVALEILLSADNAVILASIARRLTDPRDRHRALSVGMILSFGLRVLGIFIASLLIKAWPLRAAGGAYLLWVCIRRFVLAGHAQETKISMRTTTFAHVIAALTLLDAAFALDTILVAVAVSNKLWLICGGILIGMVGLRVVAGGFMTLLERFPALDAFAYVLIGWAGARLVAEAVSTFGAVAYGAEWPGMPGWLFWSGMGVIAAIGFVYVAARERRSA